MYDIAIVGLGPAGANFARLIDSKMYRVAAIDKKDMSGQGGFVKPCGGLLSPDAQRAFAKQNLPLPASVLVSPQIFCVKTIDMDNAISRNYQRAYINIDRHKFDLWMMSLVPKKIHVFDKTQVKQICMDGDAYCIVMVRGGVETAIRARFVIGADGANGAVSRCFLRKKERNLKLSIQEWYEQRDRAPFFSCVFDKENSGSYSWFLSKDDSFVFGGAYCKSGAAKSFLKQKEKLRVHGIELGECKKREACFVYRLRSARDFHIGKGNVLMLGEAAGFVSPSSYEGISGAIESGVVLSRVFNEGEGRTLARYKKATRKLRAKYTLKIVKSAILDSKVLRLAIMKSGLQKKKRRRGYGVG